jgi:hypothetical protein
MKRKKIFILSALFCVHIMAAYNTEKFVFTTPVEQGYFPLAENGQPLSVTTDEGDYKGVLRAAAHLRQDLRSVTGNAPAKGGRNTIIAGTAGKSQLIDKLISEGKISTGELSGKREKYIITIVSNPAEGIDKALVIAGSDKRGTIYGIYELSQQIGVSPWYYWADVPVAQSRNLYFKPGVYTEGEPAVAYRGIFINDEAPAFQGWAEEVFGGVNSKLYEKMFELILRLKGNFLWPAMWGNAFYYDDPLSGPLADEMGVVIGTTHHEPLGRAHEEWRYLGKGEWNYSKNPKALQEFWRGGMERMKDFETIVTVGMRGDGDEPMSEDANIALLQRIVKDQRAIISKVTGKKPEATPQVWALYKEVQDYYDKGMRVPDDITLMLCDDNWGNVRKLPDLNAPKRKGGYGMYYHFDYVGGPRNYKWINVTQVQRTWEQMNLTYEHGVDKIWVVNTGDLKPMEYPISFFLDMAWNPKRFNAQNLLQHTEQWCAQQFGEKYAQEAARMINLYTQYNSRVTPELLNDKTYSLDNYNEFATVVDDYKQLALDALRLYNLIPVAYRDAFDELVLFPINGMCNLYEMYYAVAMNKRYAASYDLRANAYADKAKECFQRDSILTEHYNKDIANGKWPHQMDQVRIGYTSWQQPPKSIMPKVEYIYRETPKEKVFVEKDGYISIEAEHFARSQGMDAIRWEVIPGLGRTLSGLSTFPQNAYPATSDAVYIEYELQTVSSGDAEIQVWLAPTLNFNANKGLRYALSVDGGKEEIVNFNAHYRGELGNWQGERIIKTPTKLHIGAAGRHTLRVRVLEPGIVFEKLTIDFGGLQPSYLGAPESEYVPSAKLFPDVPPRGISTLADHDQMMYQLGLTAPGELRINYLQSWEPEGDYYSGAKFYKPLALHDLSGLDAQSWEGRRAKIFDEVQKIYGYIPAGAAALKIDWKMEALGERKEVFGRFGPTATVPFREYHVTGRIDVSSYPELGEAPVISAFLRVPSAVAEDTKVPLVIGFTMNFGGRMFYDEGLWSAMASEGIGVLYFDPVSLQPDRGDALTGYLIGLVNKGQWRKPLDWGTLVAWSWGVSRLIDYFESDASLVDVSKVAVTGHSRYGKATLVAMAYDRRIATAFPSSSGSMGVTQSRRHWGENLENSIAESSYHWLAGNAMTYAGVDESSTDGYLPRKVNKLPVDAESLVALCAPRPIFIGCGDFKGDAWVDPYGQYLTAVAAGPVYELLGKKGLVMNDATDYNGQKIPMPVSDKSYLQGDIGFRRHSGGHEAAPNYPAFKEFILKYWKTTKQQNNN